MRPTSNAHQEGKTCITQWKHSFSHLGRKYALFKRIDSKDAPYYLHFQSGGKRYLKSCETNNAPEAISRAKRFIGAVRSEKWELVDRLKRNDAETLCGQVFTAYRSLASISDHSTENNIGAVRLILKAVFPNDGDPDKMPLSRLSDSTVAAYQTAMVERYTAGLSSDRVREARERALRSSRSLVLQARSLFARRKMLVKRYEERGIAIPESINSFMDCQLTGRQVKREYLPPPDSVVQSAFKDVDRLKNKDLNVWLAFWLAVGAGLRLGEISRIMWDHIVQRDGAWWVSGGIGKDGKKIEVPIQTRAWEQLKAYQRKTGFIISERGNGWAKRINYWMHGLGWDTEKKLHELRAYVGSLIYRHNPLAAKQFMRHTSIRMTETFYVRYRKDANPVDVL